MKINEIISLFLSFRLFVTFIGGSQAMAHDERLDGFAKDLKSRFQYMAICKPEPVTVNGQEGSRLVPFEILIGEGEKIHEFVFLPRGAFH